MFNDPQKWITLNPRSSRQKVSSASFDIVSVEACAYKNSYVLRLALRTTKSFCGCTRERRTTIHVPMIPQLLDAIVASFCQAGREEELVELHSHLKHNLKDVPVIAHQLCFSQVYFREGMQAAIPGGGPIPLLVAQLAPIVLQHSNPTI